MPITTVALATVVEPAWMRAWVDRLALGNGAGPRPRAVAGAYAGAALAWVVAAPVTQGLLAGRVPAIGVRNVSVRFDGDDAWPTEMVLIDDHFDEGVGDELVALTAQRLSDTFTAVFDAVRDAAPYGQRGLWGSLADQIATTLWLLDEGGAAPEEVTRAWEVVSRLVDAVADRAPVAIERPRLFTLDGAVLPMRGTCCLYYRTPEAVVAPDDGMCTTCPRRGDEARVALVKARRRG